MVTLSQVLSWPPLWWLVAALIFVIFAMQVEVRRGWTRFNFFRLVGTLLAVFSGGQVGKSFVDSWYKSGSAPGLEWKGALWILVTAIAGVIIAIILNLISATPKGDDHD
jgi:hypothetical protein